ncbi:MAG: cytochrome c oxidase assembly protein [Burkholderiales bacterium]
MAEAMDQRDQNRIVLRKLIVVTVAMFGFGFALVPFYKKICEVTGLSRERIAVSNTQVDFARTVTIEFDSNVGTGLPWRFEPQTVKLQVHPGELKQVFYRVVNTTDRTIVGQAIPAYAPARAASYFKKIECFCFSEQTLKPGEERLMPVQFVVQNDLPRDVHTITLSYTFYEHAPKAAAAGTAGGGA